MASSQSCDGDRVARLDEADDLRADGVEPGGAGRPVDRRARAEPLDGAVLAGRGEGALDDRVPDLAARVAGEQEAAADEDAGADPGRDREVHDVAVAAPRAEAGLADRGDVGVVRQRDGAPERLLERGAGEERRPAVGEVRRVQQQPTLVVDPAGDGDDGVLDVVAPPRSPRRR